jgi:hypothetical protein
MSDIQRDDPMPEQTDNGPRPEDGEQPADELQQPVERDDLVDE